MANLTSTFHDATLSQSDWAFSSPTEYAVDNTRLNDLNWDPISLPESPKPYTIDEAVSYYKHRREDSDVPFLTQYRREPSRTVVLATASGDRPPVPTCTSIVPRRWREKHLYWTLDLNNKSYIVKAFSGGGPGGSRYLCWDNSPSGFNNMPTGFNPTPIAFSNLKPRLSNDNSVRTGQSSASSNAHPPWKRPSQESEELQRFTQNFPFASASQLPLGKRRKTRNSTQDQNDTNDVDSSALQQTNLADPNPGPDYHVVSSELPMRTSGQGDQTRMSPLTAQQEPATSHSILSGLKQRQTVIEVRVAPELEFYNIDLTACLNAAAFYKDMLQAFDLHDKDVSKIKATFTWKAEDDKCRAMVMPNRPEEFHFKHLLKRVDEYPFWQEANEESMVEIEISRKERP